MILDPSKMLETVLTNYVESNVQPNSYDLRLNRVFEILGGIRLWEDGRKELPAYRELAASRVSQEDSPWFYLNTGKLYQLEFFEIVDMPSNMCGISVMRSSMSKSGASGEPGLYDSGYVGNCGMTVSVKHGCSIQRGASVAQLIFMEASTSSLYQGDYLDSRWSQRLVEKNVEGGVDE